MCETTLRARGRAGGSLENVKAGNNALVAQLVNVVGRWRRQRQQPLPIRHNHFARLLEEQNAIGGRGSKGHARVARKHKLTLPNKSGFEIWARERRGGREGGKGRESVRESECVFVCVCVCVSVCVSVCERV